MIWEEMLYNKINFGFQQDDIEPEAEDEYIEKLSKDSVFNGSKQTDSCLLDRD